MKWSDIYRYRANSRIFSKPHRPLNIEASRSCTSVRENLWDAELDQCQVINQPTQIENLSVFCEI